MRIRTAAMIVASSGLALTTAHSATQPKQVVTGPVAEYWMDTTTRTGFSLGGGKPSMGSMMSTMMGGGDKVHHDLKLELSSKKAATGEAKADHFVPSTLGMGASLPLYFKTTPNTPGKVEEGPGTNTYDPPKGKILIYWGCGEKARPGQPVVVDLSKLTATDARLAEFQKLTASTVKINTVVGPLPSTSTTYGEWPNVKHNKGLPGQSSIAGAHTIKGNYSPDIAFNLTPQQDFMAPLELTANAPLPSGAVNLAWNVVGNSTGYFASTIGGDGNTFVFWSSSEAQAGLMAMSLMADYLPPAEAQRLVTQKVLLSPQTTTCAVPSEVYKAAPQSLLSLTAFGGETNISYPPRPTDVKVPWNIQWTVKVRYRSSTGGLLGQSMESMMGGAQADTDSEASSSAKPEEKKKKKSMLGDMIKEGVKSKIGF
ncbi:hypothetical protein [Asticcacaulis sp. YBE204]|uniref:hypothetical protein n=1 Tax=Asticcacaulis sp. YBE204 TaxID=1282363 RepID=UPI000400B1A7|nr:hypothetical protein [Asticcacaulis sp. YBE204]